jgi:hypothetical protein
MLTSDLPKGIGGPRPSQAPFLDRLASMSEEDAVIALHDYAIKLSPGALLSFRLNLGMHASRGANAHRRAAAKWALAQVAAASGGGSYEQSNQSRCADSASAEVPPDRERATA